MTREDVDDGLGGEVDDAGGGVSGGGHEQVFARREVEREDRVPVHQPARLQLRRAGSAHIQEGHEPVLPRGGEETAVSQASARRQREDGRAVARVESVAGRRLKVPQHALPHLGAPDPEPACTD